VGQKKLKEKEAATKKDKDAFKGKRAVKNDLFIYERHGREKETRRDE